MWNFNSSLVSLKRQIQIGWDETPQEEIDHSITLFEHTAKDKWVQSQRCHITIFFCRLQ
jgi:2'-5' RNA ligase